METYPKKLTKAGEDFVQFGPGERPLRIRRREGEPGRTESELTEASLVAGPTGVKESMKDSAASLMAGGGDIAEGMASLPGLAMQGMMYGAERLAPEGSNLEGNIRGIRQTLSETPDPIQQGAKFLTGGISDYESYTGMGDLSRTVGRAGFGAAMPLGGLQIASRGKNLLSPLLKSAPITTRAAVPVLSGALASEYGGEAAMEYGAEEVAPGETRFGTGGQLLAGVAGAAVPGGIVEGTLGTAGRAASRRSSDSNVSDALRTALEELQASHPQQGAMVSKTLEDLQRRGHKLDAETLMLAKHQAGSRLGRPWSQAEIDAERAYNGIEATRMQNEKEIWDQGTQVMKRAIARTEATGDPGPLTLALLQAGTVENADDLAGQSYMALSRSVANKTDGRLGEQALAHRSDTLEGADRFIDTSKQADDVASRIEAHRSRRLRAASDAYQNNEAYNNPDNVISFFDMMTKLYAKLDNIDAGSAAILRKKMDAPDSFPVITELLRRSNGTGKMPIKAFDQERSSIVRAIREGNSANMTPAELKANDILIEVLDEYIDAAVEATGDLPLRHMRASYKSVHDDLYPARRQPGPKASDQAKIQYHVAKALTESRAGRQGTETSGEAMIRALLNNPPAMREGGSLDATVRQLRKVLGPEESPPLFGQGIVGPKSVGLDAIKTAIYEDMIKKALEASTAGASHGALRSLKGLRKHNNQTAFYRQLIGHKEYDEVLDYLQDLRVAQIARVGSSAEALATGSNLGPRLGLTEKALVGGVDAAVAVADPALGGARYLVRKFAELAEGKAGRKATASTELVGEAIGSPAIQRMLETLPEETIQKLMFLESARSGLGSGAVRGAYGTGRE